MRDNWAQYSGEFFATTGGDLRDQPLHLIFDYGYAKLRASSLHTEDEVKQFTKLDRLLRQTIETEESGTPDWVKEFAVVPSMPALASGEAG